MQPVEKPIGIEPRRLLRRRALSLAIAAASAGVLLWAAGLPTRWLAELLHRPDTSTAPSGSDDPTRSSARSAVALSPDQLKSDSGRAGTDASTSTTPLPLYLVSVAPGRNAFEGSARIGTSIANPQSYAAGAVLANGAHLGEIHPDHVLLRRGERTTKLYLHGRASPAEQSSARDELATVGGTKSPEPMHASTREVLTDYVRPSPLYDGEALRGYRVYPGRKRSVFAQLGLQSGDVITAIGGTPINDAITTLNVLRELVNGAALTVAIENSQGHKEIALDGSLIVADLHRTESLGQAQAGT